MVTPSLQQAFVIMNGNRKLRLIREVVKKMAAATTPLRAGALETSTLPCKITATTIVRG
jgi:hypothetical protein